VRHLLTATLVLVSAEIAGGIAHADPVATTTDAHEPDSSPVPPEPPPPSAAPLAIAPDGEAHNYEVAPEEESIYGGSIVRGIGTGLGWVVRVIEAPFRGIVYVESRWGTFHKIRDLFVNDARTLGIKPTARYSSGFGVTLGAKAFLDNYWGYGEDVSVSAETGGSVEEAYQLLASVPHIGGTPVYFETRVRYEENNNLLFAGIGNDMGEKSRFSQQRFLTVVGTGLEFGKLTRFRIGGSAIYNDRSFGKGRASSSDPSIETIYDTAMIPGFDDGFRNLELTGNVQLDTRDSKGATQSGGIVKAFAGGGSLIDHVDYMHYGAEASYYLTPWWPYRTFIGRVALDGVRDKDKDMPFTELPRLGGAGLLRGYLTDQFRDDLAAVGTVEYHYPIMAYLTGDLFVEAGKVADTYEQLLGKGNWHHDWHAGYGGGLIVHGRDSVKIRFDVAYGDGINFYLTTDVLDAFRKREREL
jgi:outer membrane protein assembly factor BamA